MSSYSYKPASGGLEGASTVVPLKAGGFLEVRRGEKTRWLSSETRQIWASLDAWKATLPAGAVVTEKPCDIGSAGSAITQAEWSADFKTAFELVKNETPCAPVHAKVYVESNATIAALHRRNAARYEMKARVWIERYPSYATCFSGTAAEYRKKAAMIMAAPPFERRLCRKYRSPHYWLTVLHAQRISDGEFVPIFFDVKRGVLHTPTLDGRFKVAKEGTSFAGLGVRPVFMIRTRKETPSFRLISLEGGGAVVGGGGATAGSN